MTANPSIDLSGFLDEQLTQASPDLLRSMLKTFAEALMGAQAEAICGAGYGSAPRSGPPAQRLPAAAAGHPGGQRRWDTRAGSVELDIPRLRTGSYFPDWSGAAAPRPRW